MSLLRRLGPDGQSRNPDQFNKTRFILRELLRHLADDSDLHQQIIATIEQIVADSDYELSDWDREAMQHDLAGFLDNSARREARPQPPTPIPAGADWQTIFDSVKRDVSQWLLTVGLEDLPPDFNTNEIREALSRHLDSLMQALIYDDDSSVTLSRRDRKRLRDTIMADLLGWGPLEALLADPQITDIFVHDTRRIWVRRMGIMQEVDVAFDNYQHLLRVIDRIFTPLGIRLDVAHPYAHARLPDGSRVTAVVPSLAMDGPALTIRKFNPTPLTAEQLIAGRSLTQPAWDFLRGLVQIGANILITGGPFSGRTTLLNILADTIAHDLRIVSIEHRTELRLMQPQVTRLVAVPEHIAPDLTAADMYRAAVQLGPDIVVLGDSPQSGIIDYLRVLTRVWGVLAVLEAYDPGQALVGLYDRALAETSRPSDDQIRAMLGQGVDVVVHVEQLTDGRRVVARISEVGPGWESGAPQLTDIFRYESAREESGRILGELKSTADAPSSALVQRLQDAGFDL